MTKKIRWGILGCGKIAHKFASDLRLVEDAVLSAVASRDEARARDFGKRYGAQHIFSSYQDFVSSQEIDVVYIATPHGLHYNHVMLCLEQGKAVLCEKAFALNKRQVTQMIAFAKKEQVFLMEAFWTKFLPQFQEVMRIIRSGRIGKVKMIHADFGFRAPEPPAQRLYDPVLGGGSLLDIGLYPVFLAQAILGRPSEVNAAVTNFSTGVDEQCAMTLKFNNDALAVLSSTFAADTPVEAMIAGTEGRIHMRTRFHNAMATLEIVSAGDVVTPIEVPRESGFGYQFEARHVGDCLRKGLIESPVMTHDDSLLLMDTLDRLRRTCGILYPEDSVNA